MRKVKILKAKICDVEMNWEHPNRIYLGVNLIADTIDSVKDSEKCGMKIMELRDRFKTIKITIEELK